MTIEGLEEMQDRLRELKEQKDLCESLLSKCNDLNTCARLKEKIEEVKRDILFYENELDLD